MCSDISKTLKAWKITIMRILEKAVSPKSRNIVLQEQIRHVGPQALSWWLVQPVMWQRPLGEHPRCHQYMSERDAYLVQVR
jgi:hypothetical protein